MKTSIKLFLCFAVTTMIVHAKSEVLLLDDTKGYDQIFQKIAEKRVGISHSSIDALSNPFESMIKADENGTKEDNQPSFVLRAIVSTKAKINDTWYSINDQVGAYTLVSIFDNNVVLKNDTEKKSLHIRNKNDSKVKITSK